MSTVAATSAPSQAAAAAAAPVVVCPAALALAPVRVSLSGYVDGVKRLVRTGFAWPVGSHNLEEQRSFAARLVAEHGFLEYPGSQVAAVLRAIDNCVASWVAASAAGRVQRSAAVARGCDPVQLTECRVDAPLGLWRLRDRFMWDVANAEADPEAFAQSCCEELLNRQSEAVQQQLQADNLDVRRFASEVALQIREHLAECWLGRAPQAGEVCELPPGGKRPHGKQSSWGPSLERKDPSAAAAEPPKSAKLTRRDRAAKAAADDEAFRQVLLPERLPVGLLDAALQM